MSRALPSDRATHASHEAPAGLRHPVGIPSAWDIQFDAPVGTRVLNSRFWGITTFSAGDDLIWWDSEACEWVSDDERRVRGHRASTHAPCRSYKAFLRHLRRHSHMLSGRQVVLVSCFEGHDVIAQAIEARRAETGTGSVHESAVATPCAQPEDPHNV